MHDNVCDVSVIHTALASGVEMVTLEIELPGSVSCADESDVNANTSQIVTTGSSRMRVNTVVGRNDSECIIHSPGICENRRL